MTIYTIAGKASPSAGARQRIRVTEEEHCKKKSAICFREIDSRLILKKQGQEFFAHNSVVLLKVLFQSICYKIFPIRRDKLMITYKGNFTRNQCKFLGINGALAWKES